MRIDEILLLPNSDVDFPKSEVAKFLSNPNCETMGVFPSNQDFEVKYINSGKEVVIILVDTKNKNEIVAYAGFKILNAHIWQGQNVQVYSPYHKNNIAANIYKMVKEIPMDIQSDVNQTESGKKLWTEKLPAIGLHPKIYDTNTHYILDKKCYPSKYENAIEKMYITNKLDPEKWRYTWILEHSDQYPSQNMLYENKLLMPYRGLWYSFENEKKILKGSK